MSPSLSKLERFRLTAGSALMALANPSRADMVAMVGDLTSGPVLRRLVSRVGMTEEGREMLQSLQPSRFPQKGSDSLEAMRLLKDNSLGREYARFMDKRKFTPESRDVVREGYVDGGPQEEWVLQRYRDVHDLWHVLTGLPTTLLGETAQKWFEAVHTGLPVASLAAVGGPVRLKTFDQRKALVTKYIPWAIRYGGQADNLLAIRYEDYLERDLDELRERWRITAAPR